MTDAIEDLPRIVSVNPQEELTWAARLARPGRQYGFFFKFATKFSDLSDRRYMTKGHCLFYLHRRVASAKEAQARQRHWPGRVYNRITGSDHRYVELTGHVFNTLLTYSGERALEPEQIPGTYRVRRDLAEGLLEAFSAHMRAEGHLK